MFNYTNNQHFKFGFTDGSLFSTRISSEQKFFATYGKSQKFNISWRKANELAAATIADDFQSKKLVVCLSGGSDSEICVRSFHGQGIDFSCALMKYKSSINDYEFSFAIKLCQELGLRFKVYEVDPISFWQSKDFYEIVDPIRCISPVVGLQLWLSSQVDGVPIIAQGEPHFIKKVSSDYISGISPYVPSPWLLVESERLCAMYMHFIRLKNPAVPGFFQYLPEQISSFLLQNPVLAELFLNKRLGKLGTRTSKNEMCQWFYPELKPREKKTGVEDISAEHDFVRQSLLNRYQDSNQNFYFEYEDLCSILGAPDEFSKHF